MTRLFCQFGLQAADESPLLHDQVLCPPLYSCSFAPVSIVSKRFRKEKRSTGDNRPSNERMRTSAITITPRLAWRQRLRACYRLEQTSCVDSRHGEVQAAELSVMSPLLRFRCTATAQPRAFKPSTSLIKSRGPPIAFGRRER